MALKDVNWTEVEAAGVSRMLPAGGYIAMITDAEDNERNEYARFTYDIAEGEYTGFFATDTRPYTHQFVRSYKKKAWPFFKQFLERLEESNAAFSVKTWDGEASSLIGLYVGIVVQREDYTNNSGEDRARMNVEYFTNLEDIQNNRFKLPVPKDNRDKQQGTNGAIPASEPGNGASIYDGDVPF